MSLTNLHASANYQDELHQFIKKVEGLVLLPYFDAKDNSALVTIGIGANIDTESKYLRYVLAELGIDGAVSEIDSTKTANVLIKAAMDSVPNGSANDLALQTALNDVLRKNFPSRFGPTSEFKLTETQVYNVLDKIVADKKIALDAKLTANGIDVAAMQNTKEYLVLTSLDYNTKQGATNLIGPKLLSAITNDNRAEAWYEIRYGSNKNGIHASRRYAEAALFGLYDAGTLSKDQEIDQSKEILQMYTEHNAEILAYESKYAPASSIQNEIGRAKTFLITNFGQGKAIDGEVIVGQGLKTAAYEQLSPADDIIMTIGNKNNLIFGEGGDDSIISGDGNDVIYGGKGDDFISGGKGMTIWMGAQVMTTITL